MPAAGHAADVRLGEEVDRIRVRERDEGIEPREIGGGQGGGSEQGLTSHGGVAVLTGGAGGLGDRCVLSQLSFSGAEYGMFFHSLPDSWLLGNVPGKSFAAPLCKAFAYRGSSAFLSTESAKALIGAGTFIQA